MAYLTQNPAKEERWVCFYPQYINSSLSLPQGRKISKSDSVVSPSLEEIQQALKSLGLPFLLQSQKMYPRDFFVKGRVKVQLKKEDETFLRSDISSRKQLWKNVASFISKIPNRQIKSEKDLGAVASTSLESSSGNSRKGKKGKKGRK
eukprot:Sdes_comp18160_c0_seq2m7650